MAKRLDTQVDRHPVEALLRIDAGSAAERCLMQERHSWLCGHTQWPRYQVDPISSARPATWVQPQYNRQLYLPPFQTVRGIRLSATGYHRSRVLSSDLPQVERDRILHQSSWHPVASGIRNPSSKRALHPVDQPTS